jgi:hypothetical protein
MTASTNCQLPLPASRQQLPGTCLDPVLTGQLPILDKDLSELNLYMLKGVTLLQAIYIEDTPSVNQ